MTTLDNPQPALIMFPCGHCEALRLSALAREPDQLGCLTCSNAFPLDPAQRDALSIVAQRSISLGHNEILLRALAAMRKVTVDEVLADNTAVSGANRDIAWHGYNDLQGVSIGDGGGTVLGIPEPAQLNLEEHQVLRARGHASLCLSGSGRMVTSPLACAGGSFRLSFIQGGSGAAAWIHHLDSDSDPGLLAGHELRPSIRLASDGEFLVSSQATTVRLEVVTDSDEPWAVEVTARHSQGAVKGFEAAYRDLAALFAALRAFTWVGQSGSSRTRAESGRSGRRPDESRGSGG